MIWLRAWLIVCLGVACIGCGPESKMITVTGTVSVDGQPAKSGSISFVPLDGLSPMTGGVIAEGKFKCEAPLGESKVEIRVPKVVGKKKLYDTPDSPVQEVLAEVLPPRYNEKSELRFTGVKGKNEPAFDLTTTKS